jgi:hypothetical protein
MFNRLATQVDKSSQPKLPHPGPPPDSEGVQKPPVPGTVYMPYAEKPALSEPPYRPYREKPAQDEHPYEPYKDI